MLVYFKSDTLISTQTKYYSNSSDTIKCFFTGQITNINPLRKKLEKAGIYLESVNPSNIIISLYLTCGDAFVKDLDGKFAFIIIDTINKTVFAARDRFGCEPLYYTQLTDGIGFTTDFFELKEMLKINSYEMNYPVLNQYFDGGFIDEENTVIKNVLMLPAGCYLFYNSTSKIIEPFTYLLTFEGSCDNLACEKSIYEVIKSNLKKYLKSDLTYGILYTGQLTELVMIYLVKQAGFDIRVFSTELSTLKRTGVNELNIDVIHIHEVVDNAQYLHATKQALKLLSSPIYDKDIGYKYLNYKMASKYVDKILSVAGADLYFEEFRPRLKFSKKVLKKLLIDEDDPFITQDFEYFEQIHSIEKNLRNQTLEVNSFLKGSTIRENHDIANHFDLDIIFPFLDIEIFEEIRMINYSDKINMKLFKKIFDLEIKNCANLKSIHGRKQDALPIKKWIKNEYYSEIKKLFDDELVDVLFCRSSLYKILESHVAGFKNYDEEIWSIVQFLMWFNHFVR